MALKTRMQKNQFKHLCQLLGCERLSLLYKGSVHGYTSGPFNLKTENQGPTVVVAYNGSGCVYGGCYNLKGGKAFLFRLEEEFSLCKTIPVTDAGTVVYTQPGNDPSVCSGQLSFGKLYNFPQRSHFVQTSLFLLSQIQSVTTADIAINEFSAADLHGNDFQITEFEAYRAEDMGDIVEFPWRTISWTIEEKKRLMDVAKNYKPAVHNIPHIRVLMVGPVGAGKSSFFNSVNSIFRNHVAPQAEAGSDATSVTTNFRTYTIKDGRCGKPLPIMLCDTMGLEERPGAGLEIEDIPKILEGHVPDRYQFNPTSSIEESTSGYIKSPTLGEKIHVVVYILDACKVEILSEKMEEKLRHVRAKIKKHGVPQLVLLTKVDELCSALAADVRNAYVSKAVEKQIYKASSRLGISVSNILPVKNYCFELDLEDSIDILLLHAVQQIMRMADLYFDDLAPDKEQ